MYRVQRLGSHSQKWSEKFQNKYKCQKFKPSRDITSETLVAKSLIRNKFAKAFSQREGWTLIFVTFLRGAEEMGWRKTKANRFEKRSLVSDGIPLKFWSAIEVFDNWTNRSVKWLNRWFDHRLSVSFNEAWWVVMHFHPLWLISEMGARGGAKGWTQPPVQPWVCSRTAWQVSTSASTSAPLFTLLWPAFLGQNEGRGLFV